MRIRKSEEVTCGIEAAAWLQRCRDQMVAGIALRPDPFYERNALLTPEIVDKVIKDTEGLFVFELTNSSQYHYDHHGLKRSEAVLILPGFDKISAIEKRAVVQGLDRIFQAHRMTPADEAAEIVAEANRAEAARLYSLERAANLDADPHYYDYEMYDYE